MISYKYYNDIKTALLKDIKFLLLYLLICVITLPTFVYLCKSTFADVNTKYALMFFVGSLFTFALIKIELGFDKRKDKCVLIIDVIKLIYNPPYNWNVEYLNAKMIMDDLIQYRRPIKNKIVNYIYRNNLNVKALLKNIKTKHFNIPVPNNLWCNGQVWTTGFVKAIVKDQKVKVGTYWIDSNKINPINSEENKLQITFFDKYKYFYLFTEYLKFKVDTCESVIADKHFSNRYLLIIDEPLENDNKENTAN